jgi:hypothetical protein
VATDQARDEEAGGGGVTLRLLGQWQGAGTCSVRELAPEFLLDVARRGDAVGPAVLAAARPANYGRTATAPVVRELSTGTRARRCEERESPRPPMSRVRGRFVRADVLVGPP